jgi:hypothetical protein
MANDSANSAKIRVRTIIEVLGKPKEHIEKTIREYVEKIKEDNDFVVLKEHFSDSEEQKHGEDTYFAIFVELEFLVKGLHPLIGFCFNYMPSSIEIEKPEELTLPADMMNALFNDLQARLHKVDMIVKQQVNENQFLRNNLRASMRNLIVITLASHPMDMEKLVKSTGIETEVLQKFVDELIKENKIEKDGDTYRTKRAK